MAKVAERVLVRHARRQYATGVLVNVVELEPNANGYEYDRFEFDSGDTILIPRSWQFDFDVWIPGEYTFWWENGLPQGREGVISDESELF